jgi:hypothetical protein
MVVFGLGALALFAGWAAAVALAGNSDVIELRSRSAIQASYDSLAMDTLGANRDRQFLSRNEYHRMQSLGFSENSLRAKGLSVPPDPWVVTLDEVPSATPYRVVGLLSLALVVSCATAILASTWWWLGGRRHA